MQIAKRMSRGGGEKNIPAPMSRYINALQAAKNRARNGKSIRMPLGV